MLKNKKEPEFYGIFADTCKAFIAYKRATGLKYASEAKIMSRFSRFADEFGQTENVLSKPLVLAWIEKRPGEAEKSREHRHSTILQFAAYLVNHGHHAYIAPKIRYKGSRHFTPYIFTHNEIARIFENTDNIPLRSVSPYIHKVLPTLIRMLYGCGLRVSEALSLTNADVDLERGILTIKHAKFDQDRLVPMDESLIEVCRNYRAGMVLTNGDYFFPARDHSQIAPLTIYNRFREILCKSGIPYNGKGSGPRLHDLRHTFSVHTLQKWISDGNDIYCMLPLLSAYLGHEQTASTGRYLRLTAEVYPEIVETISQNCGFVIPAIKLLEKGDAR
jgi:integrase